MHRYVFVWWSGLVRNKYENQNEQISRAVANQLIWQSFLVHCTLTHSELSCKASGDSLYKYIWQFGQICFGIWTNIFDCSENTFWNLDKYHLLITPTQSWVAKPGQSTRASQNRNSIIPSGDIGQIQEVFNSKDHLRAMDQKCPLFHWVTITIIVMYHFERWNGTIWASCKKWCFQISCPITQ